MRIPLAALLAVAPDPTPVDAPAPPAQEAPVAAARPSVLDPKGADQLVAVLDLTHDAHDAPLHSAIVAVIASEVAARPGFTAVSRAELQAVLKQQADAALLGCDKPSCAADIAKLVDAQRVIAGTLARIEGAAAGPSDKGVAWSVSLALIDPALPAVIRRTDATWRGAPEEMTTLVAPLLDRLLASDDAAAATLVGALDVTAPDGAQLFLDGKAIERRAGAPVVDIPIGAHVLEASAAGYVPLRRDVVVRRGETTAVLLEMEAEPFYGQWWFWTAVGTGTAVVVGGGAVVGTVLALSQQQPPTTLVVKAALPVE